MQKVLIIFLIFLGGIILLYLAVSYFFEEPPREISFEPEQKETKEMKADFPAPDFEALNLNGEKSRLSDYKNKIVVLIFWTTWNPAAQDQIAILESYFEEIKGNQDLALFAINSLEPKSSVSHFIQRGEYILPILLDEEGRIGELYKISALPLAYFIDRNGQVKEIFVGVLNKEEIKSRVEKLY